MSRVLIAFLVLLLMAACAAPPARIPTGSHDRSSGDISDVVVRVNRLRAEVGRGSLSAHAALTRAARDHVQDMITNQFFGHFGVDGSLVGDRVRRWGYDWCAIAENIARGPSGLTEVLESWMASPSHRANILAGDFVHLGLYRGGQDHWVMVLGQNGCLHETP
ncbi:MAG: CAP domain-containing protein [Rhodobacteraceae bacterium]|nr:CAP domain-containing protein [Paracoccaceae bacterium]